MMLALLAGSVSACGDDSDDSGCRGLDSDHDGLVYKCDAPYDASYTEPPPKPRVDAGSGTKMDAGNDDEDDAGQD